MSNDAILLIFKGHVAYFGLILGLRFRLVTNVSSDGGVIYGRMHGTGLIIKSFLFIYSTCNGLGGNTIQGKDKANTDDTIDGRNLCMVHGRVFSPKETTMAIFLQVVHLRKSIVRGRKCINLRV